MQKEFIPYEQALELKELGFDEPCFAFWSDIEDNKFTGNYTIRIGLESIENKIQGIRYKGFLSAPTFSQAFRWFREKYGDLLRYDWGEVPHFLMIQIEMTKGKTYEEAELACLKKLIEIVKQPKKH